MNPFELSVSLNNRAVTLLSSPEGYSAAISHLKEALSAMKSILQLAHDTSSSIPLETAYICEISLTECLLKSMRLRHHDHDVDDQELFLHREAIFIRNELANVTGYRERSMISCIIIFNLALAYHLSAADAMVSDTMTALYRALRLYELCFNLLREELGEAIVLFPLAVINNVALVHRQLGNEEPATRCFEMILSTLMCLADQKSVHQLPLDGFFINTRYLISKDLVAPAA
ncbi:hypothetical protein IV203_009782 [Nitzschia inconspicua]|uniref:Uncharacterized protein n=1 Tax=Nitzschia inconspicua TaxID=303405 RepID=A0A9K3KVI7_9STRA|nr:hypothetical protein IV203_009782 [Nitzschia inconspicua]